MTTDPRPGSSPPPSQSQGSLLQAGPTGLVTGLRLFPVSASFAKCWPGPHSLSKGADPPSHLDVPLGHPDSQNPGLGPPGAYATFLCLLDGVIVRRELDTPDPGIFAPSPQGWPQGHLLQEALQGLLPVPPPQTGGHPGLKPLGHVNGVSASLFYGFPL